MCIHLKITWKWKRGRRGNVKCDKNKKRKKQIKRNVKKAKIEHGGKMKKKQIVRE